MEELYQQVYAKGIKIAAFYVGKEGLEEDMLHEAFLKAVGNLDKFDESRPFQAWFDVILANTCKSYLRKKKPELMSEYADEDSATDEAFGELSTIGNPEENWDQKELRQIIMNLLMEAYKVALEKEGYIISPDSGYAAEIRVEVGEEGYYEIGCSTKEEDEHGNNVYAITVDLMTTTFFDAVYN